MSFEHSQASTYNIFPTRENPVMYKINSFWIELDASMTTIERSTYSILDWVGDIGGLLDGLRFIGSFLLAPIATFLIRIELYKRTTTQNDRQKNNYWSCSLKQAKYKRAQLKLTKQLDVISLVQRQRMLLLAVIAMLSPKQRKLVQHLSERQIPSDDDFSEQNMSKQEKEAVINKARVSNDHLGRQLTHLFQPQLRESPSLQETNLLEDASDRPYHFTQQPTAHHSRHKIGHSTRRPAFEV